MLDTRRTIKKKRGKEVYRRWKLLFTRMMKYKCRYVSNDLEEIMQLLIQVPCCGFVKLIKVNCEGKRNLDLREEYLLLTILLWEFLLLIKKKKPLFFIFTPLFFFFFINKFSLIQNTYKKEHYLLFFLSIYLFKDELFYST